LSGGFKALFVMPVREAILLQALSCLAGGDRCRTVIMAGFCT
jgi:hypothetical protein